MSNLKYVNDDEEFNALLKSAGSDVVVLDFFTTWCGPCRAMGPAVESMAMKYPKVLFLKIDADKCFETAMNHNVKGVPLFVIYMNMQIVDEINGARPQELDEKVKHYEQQYRKANPSFSHLPQDQLSQLSQVISSIGKVEDVSKYLDDKGCRCINDLSPTSFEGFLSGKKLVSGKGSGKLVLVYSFKEKLMLHSFKIKAHPEIGPKVLRLFANHPKLLDFTVGSQLAPSQEVTLHLDDLSGDRLIELRAGSFSLVSNLQIFITQGMSTKSHRVEIESLTIYGAPVQMAKSTKPSITAGLGLPNTSGRAQNQAQAQVKSLKAEDTLTAAGTDHFGGSGSGKAVLPVTPTVIIMKNQEQNNPKHHHDHENPDHHSYNVDTEKEVPVATALGIRNNIPSDFDVRLERSQAFEIEDSKTPAPSGFLKTTKIFEAKNNVQVTSHVEVNEDEENARRVEKKKSEKGPPAKGSKSVGRKKSKKTRRPEWQ